MTRFIDVQSMADLVERIGVARFIGELAERIEADFRRWPEFEKTPRVASHSEVGVIELMPVADRSRYAFKYVNGHPANTAHGLSTVMAFGVLAEVETGYPLLLSELTFATALRTAATSLVAARTLARPGPQRMALIGNGAQSEFQAIAFHAHLGIEEITAFDPDRAATERLIRNLRVCPRLAVRRVESIEEALDGADIVTTITADKRRAAIITADRLAPGLHLNAVGGDCPGKTELAPEVLAAARVFVEYEPQTRIEGDLQQMPADFPVTELWRVLTGEAQGRVREDEITVFDSVGFALEDYSTLCLIEERSRALGIGQRVELVPELDDPKDLFGKLRRSADRARLCRAA